MFALDLLEPGTAFMIGVGLFLILLVPFLIWEMTKGKARGHSWFTRWKPRGHGDIGADLGDPSSNPYSARAQARR
jgi:hypothetical protein